MTTCNSDCSTEFKKYQRFSREKLILNSVLCTLNVELCGFQVLSDGYYKFSPKCESHDLRFL